MNIYKFNLRKLLMMGSLALMVSCYKEKPIETDDIYDTVTTTTDSVTTLPVDSSSYYPTVDSALPTPYTEEPALPETNTIPIPEPKIQYVFAVFETQSNFFENEQYIHTSGIVESSEMTEDDKYIFLDKAQSNIFQYNTTETITSRWIEIYDSYAEASKARERILGY